ncbi:MAG: rRNA maturation RNase YbeY [Campylobacteraceae bacterium]|jgi:probable rRNA maturation factor|nr:rRNA maturation RNase YbeY [Campylobacteraceae bacterium]
MLIIENSTDFDVDTKRLEMIANTLSQKDIECIFVNSQDMLYLNLSERNINKTTDVLSFPLDDIPHAPLGTIVINLELANLTAKELNHSPNDESALLFIHGLLHLLGFDHEIDNGEMRAKERELIERFSLPESLICRTIPTEQSDEES